MLKTILLSLPRTVINLQRVEENWVREFFSRQVTESVRVQWFVTATTLINLVHTWPSTRRASTRCATAGKPLRPGPADWNIPTCSAAKGCATGRSNASVLSGYVDVFLSLLIYFMNWRCFSVSDQSPQCLQCCRSSNTFLRSVVCLLVTFKPFHGSRRHFTVCVRWHIISC